MRSAAAVLLVGLWPLVVLADERPQVSHFTTPGRQHNELWLIQGHHFAPGRPQVLHYLVPGDKPDTMKAGEWLQDVGKAQPLPAEPPEGSRALEVVDATEDTLVVRGVRSNCPLFIFWVRTPAGLSAPQLVNQPEPYWVGRRRMTPDEIGMIFGKACNVEFRFGLVALKARDTGQVRLAEFVEAEHNRTGGLLPFRVPVDTPPGHYEVWVHNGSGGKLGWGGPLALEVVPKPSPPAVVNAREHGVKGDGVTDETQALQRALDAAGERAKRGPAVVALSPGTHNVSATVTVPAGVTLQGSGAENCFLRGVGYDPRGPRRWWNSRAADPAAVVQLVSHAGLRELTATGQTAQGVGNGTVQIQERQLMDPVIGASIRNCRVLGEDHEVVPSYGMYLRLTSGGGVRCGPEVRDLEIYDSKFEDCGVTLGRVTRAARVVRNDLVGIGGRSYVDCYFARNTVHGGFKGFTASIWPGSNYHNLYALNKVYDVASGREGSDGEEFCIHGEGADKFGRRVGAVTSATDRSLTDKAADWAEDEMKLTHVAILSGRGRGQYRLIVGNTRDTVKVDRPWAVTPDASSRYLVAGMFVENTYLYNTTWSGSWMLLYKGNIASVVEGHETNRSAGITLFTNDGSQQGKPAMDTHLSLGWYNEVRGCLLDHASVKFLFQTLDNNVRRASSQVGNKVISCTFRNSLPNHTSFTGSSSAPIRQGLQGAILFARERLGNDQRSQVSPDPLVYGSHTFVEGNTFSDSPVGVAIFEHSDRTFITGNTFWQVEQPLLDLGRGTRFWGNQKQRFDQEGRHLEALADIPAWRPAAPPLPLQPATSESAPPAQPGQYMALIRRLDELVAGPGGYFYNMSSPEVMAGCRANLAEIWRAVRHYAGTHGGKLPDACFFPDPDKPADQRKPTFAKLLGLDGKRCVLCPGSGQEQLTYGVTYLWNELWNGKRLAEIPNPRDEWLVMDLIALNPFVAYRIGHDRGAHILYADGHVEHRRYTGKDGLLSWEAWARRMAAR